MCVGKILVAIYLGLYLPNKNIFNIQTLKDLLISISHKCLRQALRVK